MNKYQEAFANVKRACMVPFLGRKPIDVCGVSLDRLKELVERATPKKAILVHDYDGLVFECPVCHMEFRPDTIMNHVKWEGCPYCLQKLDWSEEE